MFNRQSLIFLLFIVSSTTSIGQETDYGPGYQTLIINNPACAGTSLDGILKLSYINFYPGHNYNFHSVFLSYDSYFQALHGGTGVYIANDYLGGIVNDLRGGASYSYFLQAGRNVFINAGLSASFFHRGFDFRNAVFPDQIDPMGGITLPTSELMSDNNRTVFDVGTGFILIVGNLTGGFAITHLTQPDLGVNKSSVEKIKRKFVLHFSGAFDLRKVTGLSILPFALMELQGNFFCAGAGATLKSNYLSVSSMLIVNNNRETDIQAGFSFKRERFGLFYSYRFNLGSGNALLPFSLMHQTGLTISLNNVEKRIKVRTINVPDM